ncbi:hypothetical protein ACOBV8_17970 [Pseudoalteromonas espejiana]
MWLPRFCFWFGAIAILVTKTFYNADVFVTRKGLTMPDFKGEREVFIAFKDIEAMYINYFPLTPLLWFGPYISTHLTIKSVNGERYGVHTFNLSDYRTIVNYLAKVHNVKIKHRFFMVDINLLISFPNRVFIGVYCLIYLKPKERHEIKMSCLIIADQIETLKLYKQIIC